MVVILFVGSTPLPLGLPIPTPALSFFKLIPLSITIWHCLGEKIGLIRWTAVITGLLGVFLMIDPISIIKHTSGLSSLGLYLAFGSAITHAGLALILRKIGKTEHPATTALIHNLITSFVIIFLIIVLGTKF